MRNGFLAHALLGALFSVASCRGVEVPPEGLPELFAAVEADPVLHETALDGCVQIHHLWKPQVRAVHRTAGEGIQRRVRMLVDSVRVPFASFWDGYVSSGFERWARTELDLANDPRSKIPIQIDVADLIGDDAGSVTGSSFAIHDSTSGPVSGTGSSGSEQARRRRP